jgi:SAM-dependent methyltransferase
MGGFITTMESLGWRVMGVDTDPRVVDACRSRGLDVRMGSLDEIGLPSDEFDVVVLRHVIEHVTDPVKLMEEIRRILRPDGRVVLLTPNIESIGYAEFGEYWLGLDPPRHLILFRSETLKQLLITSGFDIVSLASTPRISRFNFLASYLQKAQGKSIYSSKASTLAKLKAVIFTAKVKGRLRENDAVGDELMVIGRKEHGA